MFYFKQKTAYEMRISDWSSDVCSSDLRAARCAVDGAKGGRMGQPDVPDLDRRQLVEHQRQGAAATRDRVGVLGAAARPVVAARPVLHPLGWLARQDRKRVV